MDKPEIIKFDDKTLMLAKAYKNVLFRIEKGFTTKAHKWVPDDLWLVGNFLYKNPYIFHHLDIKQNLIRLERGYIDNKIYFIAEQFGYRPLFAYMVFWYFRLFERSRFNNIKRDTRSIVR